MNAATWTPAASFIALAAPNVCQIMHRHEPAFETYLGKPKKLNAGSLTWQPNRVWAMVLTIASFMTLDNLTHISEFLRFQF